MNISKNIKNKIVLIWIVVVDMLICFMMGVSENSIIGISIDSLIPIIGLSSMIPIVLLVNDNNDD